MKTFTIIYLDVDKKPRETFKQEYRTKSPSLALQQFCNEKEHNNHFVAAIVASKAEKVYFTK